MCSSDLTAAANAVMAGTPAAETSTSAGIGGGGGAETEPSTVADAASASAPEETNGAEEGGAS